MSVKQKKLTANHIDAIRKQVKYFEDRKNRAKEREEYNKKEFLSFALVGFRIKNESFIFSNDKILIQIVNEPPGIVELASALKDKSLLDTVSRYANFTKYEMLIHNDSNLQSALNLAYNIIAGIRIKSCSDFLVPVAFDCSVSTISAHSDSSICAYIIEDYPRARSYEKHKIIKVQDLKWVDKYILNIFKAMEHQNIRLAIEEYCSNNQQASIRMSIASLWSGIESILRIPNELSFRIALYASVILYERGVKRKEAFSTMKKMYNFRSKVIHGIQLRNDELIEHCILTKSILAKLLVLVIEKGGPFTQEEIEDMLLT